MTTTYTRAEVAKHASADDNWIIIDDTVYDVSKFARFHPGGRAFVDGVAGRMRRSSSTRFTVRTSFARWRPSTR